MPHPRLEVTQRSDASEEMIVGQSVQGLSKLPEEILINILLELDLPSIINLSRTSKQFNKLFKGDLVSQSFYKQLLQKWFPVVATKIKDNTKVDYKKEFEKASRRLSKNDVLIHRLCMTGNMAQLKKIVDFSLLMFEHKVMKYLGDIIFPNMFYGFFYPYWDCFSVIHLALNNNRTDFLKDLYNILEFQRSYDNNLLKVAFHQMTNDELKALTNYKFELKELDDKDKVVALYEGNLLHAAIYFDAKEIALELMKNSTLINKTMKYWETKNWSTKKLDTNRTPLTISIEKGDIEMAGQLLNHGADVWHGYTLPKSEEQQPCPIILAINRRRLNFIALFIEHQPDVVNKNDHACIKEAMRCKNPSIIKLLLDSNHLDFTQKPSELEDLLLLALEMNDKDTFLRLLQMVKNIAIKEQKNVTEKHWHDGKLSLQFDCTKIYQRVYQKATKNNTLPVELATVLYDEFNKQSIANNKENFSLDRESIIERTVKRILELHNTNENFSKEVLSNHLVDYQDNVINFKKNFSYLEKLQILELSFQEIIKKKQSSYGLVKSFYNDEVNKSQRNNLKILKSVYMDILKDYLSKTKFENLDGFENDEIVKHLASDESKSFLSYNRVWRVKETTSSKELEKMLAAVKGSVEASQESTASLLLGKNSL